MINLLQLLYVMLCWIWMHQKMSDGTIRISGIEALMAIWLSPVLVPTIYIVVYLLISQETMTVYWNALKKYYHQQKATSSLTKSLPPILSHIYASLAFFVRPNI